MSTTPETPTPETDAAIDDSPYYQSRFVMVSAEFAERLERERDAARAEIEAMREAIRNAHKFIRDIVKNYECGERVDREGDAALAKLEPFIKP